MEQLMVASVKRKRIITGESPVEELQRRFSDELREMGKKAALELGCNVEELKYQFNNAGIVEFQKMTPQEMIDLGARDAHQKKVIAIKEARGVL
jgi:hypothetical protein